MLRVVHKWRVVVILPVVAGCGGDADATGPGDEPEWGPNHTLSAMTALFAPFDRVTPDNLQVACADSGRFHVTISGSGASTTLTWEECQELGWTIDGSGIVTENEVGGRARFVGSGFDRTCAWSLDVTADDELEAVICSIPAIIDEDTDVPVTPVPPPP